MRFLDFDSIRFRFLVGAVLWVSVATIVAGFFISSLYRVHITEQFRDELEVHLTELIGLTTTDGAGRPELIRPLSDPRFLEMESGFYWQISRSGVKTLKSPSLGDRKISEAFALDQNRRSGWTVGAVGEILEYGVTASVIGSDKPLHFSIASERRLLEDILSTFNTDLAASLVVFALLMVVGAALQVKFGLSPVSAIADNIENLRQGKVARLSQDVPSEFGALVKRLNSLLDGQAELVKRARVETGNLAHGLRTPLALIVSEAEEIERAGRLKEADFILRQCLEIQRQTDYYTMRARAAGTRVTGYVANISGLIEKIVGAMRRLYAGKSLSITVDVPSILEVNCDEGDLSEILSNLLDNACKWATAHVIVRGRLSSGQAHIEVQDDGPGIAPEKRLDVFKIGMKLDETKAGSGLGLAISKDLARLYGGDLELLDAPGGGIIARLSIPESSSS